jgi:hypothetical protein
MAPRVIEHFEATGNRWLGVFLPWAAWVGLVWLMVRDWQRDPYNPALEGTAAYGHNLDGVQLTGPLLSGLELALAFLILRPWSYQRSWVRALIALALLSPWALVNTVVILHLGGIGMLHVMWLWTLWLALALLTVVSGTSAFIGWRYRRESIALPARTVRGPQRKPG